MTTTADTNEKSSERIVTLLPPSLYRQLAADAAQRKTSAGALVREILARHYCQRSQEEAAR
jgi:hypothetical protein